VIDLAGRYGARFVRTRLGGQGAGASSVARRLGLVAVNCASRLAWQRVPVAYRGARVSFITVGFLEAGGEFTASRLLTVLDDLRRREPGPDIVEVMLHPGHRDGETERKYGHWGYRWHRDLARLLDPTLPEALACRGIEVTSF